MFGGHWKVHGERGRVLQTFLKGEVTVMAINRRKLITSVAGMAALSAVSKGTSAEGASVSGPIARPRPRQLSKGPLMRIDNVFFNTRDVAKLANFYSTALQIPTRREQTLSGLLMWMEINYGGMELSFRLAEGTLKLHEDLKPDFLELRPGDGATVSFEVDDMKQARESLASRGVKFHGSVINCTDGEELLSIFEDHRGRPLQLYQPRFKTPGVGFEVAARPVGALDAETMKSKRVQIGSNLRDVRDMALDVVFYDDDLIGVRRFYGDVLQLPVHEEQKNRIRFVLDASILEFRKPTSTDPLLKGIGKPPKGGIVAFEVSDLPFASDALTLRGVKPLVVSNGRTAFQDSEGNSLELWQNA